jgi:hypothetical protein
LRRLEPSRDAGPRTRAVNPAQDASRAAASRLDGRCKLHLACGRGQGLDPGRCWLEAHRPPRELGAGSRAVRLGAMEGELPAALAKRPELASHVGPARTHGRVPAARKPSAQASRGCRLHAFGAGLSIARSTGRSAYRYGAPTRARHGARRCTRRAVSYRRMPIDIMAKAAEASRCGRLPRSAEMTWG